MNQTKYEYMYIIEYLLPDWQKEIMIKQYEYSYSRDYFFRARNLIFASLIRLSEREAGVELPVTATATSVETIAERGTEVVRACVGSLLEQEFELFDILSLCDLFLRLLLLVPTDC